MHAFYEIRNEFYLKMISYSRNDNFVFKKWFVSEPDTKPSKTIV